MSLEFASLCQDPFDIYQLNGSHLLVDDQNKYRSMWIRAYSSLWMLGSFAIVVYLGHLYIWSMIVVIQIFMARELFCILKRAQEERRLPGFWILNWWETHRQAIFCFLCKIVSLSSLKVETNLHNFSRHFFFTAFIFVYGRILSQQLVNTVKSDKFFYRLVSGLIKYQMAICYFLYIAGLWFWILIHRKRSISFFLLF